MVRDMYLIDAGEDACRIEETLDYYKFTATIPGDKAFNRVAESNLSIAEEISERTPCKRGAATAMPLRQPGTPVR